MKLVIRASESFEYVVMVVIKRWADNLDPDEVVSK